LPAHREASVFDSITGRKQQNYMQQGKIDELGLKCQDAEKAE